VRQFLGESFLLIAIALLVAVGLTAAGIPLINHSLSLHLSFSGWNILIFLLLLFPLIALGGGLYPAFVLSSYQPIKVLKGSSSGKGRGFILRKMLTIVQFVIALAMLTGTAVIYSQMEYIAHKDLGVDRSGIARIQLPVDDSLLQGRSKTFCEALRHETSVHGLSVGAGMPIEGASLSSSIVWSDNGKKREMMCRYFMIDPVFLPLLKISLASGRNFGGAASPRSSSSVTFAPLGYLSDSLSTDKTEAFLVNEAFVSKMGWKKPIGQAMEGQGSKGKVVGVVRNFFYSSLHNVIEPLAMVYTTARTPAVLVKISPRDLPRIKEIWKSYFPDRVIDYGFLDQEFKEQYNKDRMMMFLFNGFTAFALFISCLGLYGLVALITLQRTKELGIRKVTEGTEGYERTRTG
jgi:putative ABC transport system permease protein